MPHLVEQATDFSNTKYIASNQSLVWSIARSCLTFPEVTSPGIPGPVYQSSERIHKRPCKRPAKSIEVNGKRLVTCMATHRSCIWQDINHAK